MFSSLSGLAGCLAGQSNYLVTATTISPTSLLMIRAVHEEREFSGPGGYTDKPNESHYWAARHRFQLAGLSVFTRPRIKRTAR